MQVARSAICRATVLGWYLTTCSAEFKTHARHHAHIHPHIWPHTDVRKHTEAWRVEMKYPPHQPYAETRRPRPGDRDHTSDHMTLGYRCTPVLFVLSPISKAMLCLTCFKNAYFNIGALKKISTFSSVSNYLILGFHTTKIMPNPDTWVHVCGCMVVCHHNVTVLNRSEAQ